MHCDMMQQYVRTRHGSMAGLPWLRTALAGVVNYTTPQISGDVMPSFWEAIQAASGANAMGVIRFDGRLNLEKDTTTNNQGAVFVHAAERTTGYDLSVVADNAGNSADIKKVYWLPWKNRSAEKVLLTDLNNSGCDYFLTSMLSGCRFVATEFYVAHISNEQGISDSSVTTTREGRDLAEGPLLAPSKPTEAHGYSESRRKLSISPLPVGESASRGLEAIAKHDIIASYQRGDKAGVGSALVLGYKVGEEWTYKWLKFTAGANSPEGTWAIL
jgi:hypothetical protein